MWNLEDELKALHAENKVWEKEFSTLMNYQNSGMEYEKKGDLPSAAQSYEQSIKFGRASKRMRINNFFHSIDRLVIVYRKLKKYEDEIRVIEDSLRLDKLIQKDREKFSQRLAKAKQLQEKANQ